VKAQNEALKMEGHERLAIERDRIFGEQATALANLADSSSVSSDVEDRSRESSLSGERCC